MSSRIRPIGREHVDEIIHGNAVDQIDSVTGQVEHVSVDMHAMSVDGDDHRTSASPVPDAESFLLIQFNLLFLGGSTLKPMAMVPISSLSLRE